jgi:hypothetical protein
MLNGMTFHLKKYPFVWTLIFLVLLFYLIQNVKGHFKMHDLEVDYTATQHFLHGQQIYNQPFGLTSGLYKYSPFTLCLLIPLALLPFFLAKTIYFFLTAGLIIYTTIFLERFLTEHFFQNKPIGCQNILLLSTLVVIVHYERELSLGNHNVLLLTILLFSLNFIIHNQEYPAGILIGLVILMKPHFLVLLPLFLLRKKFNTLASVIGCIVFGLMFPAIIFGWSKNLELLLAWLNTMLVHNANINFTTDTLQAWLYKSGIKYLYPKVGILYALGVILFVAFWFFLFVMRNYTKESNNTTRQIKEKLAVRDLIFEYLSIIALIPNLVVTDSEHFLWSLPIIMFIWTHLLYEHQKRDMLFYVSMLIFLLYGGDWYEVWGRKLSMWIEHTGLLGLGNILMLLNAVYIFNRKSRMDFTELPADSYRPDIQKSF